MEYMQKIILKGIPASPGWAQGKVKVIKTLAEIQNLGKGEIVVVSFLTPDFIPFIRNNPQVSGIITDKGGSTCHAAIIAREFKIPYIAAAIGATKKLKNNTIITMDSETGIIYAA